MTYTNPDAEETLELATMALFADLGWQTANAYDDDLGREHRGEVILRDRLLAALHRLNPGLPDEAFAQAIEELARDRGAMAMVRANHEIYRLLKDGVKAAYHDGSGEEQIERVRLVDWQTPANNDFLLAQQFWVAGETYTRRADLVGFVNGLPLFFGELKAHHKRVEDAYNNNLRDYKETVPHLFWTNGFILLSNGSDARIGSITSGWEHFSAWKKINDEGETGVIDLDTAVRGTCAPDRFLDLVENFCLFQESLGGLTKIVAHNHQYLGVNNAIDAVHGIKENEGRLGVYWHTQGSGKSFSMVFFCQKVLRTLPGNWTFVILTDRIDLDDQIYKNFARCGAVIESEDRVRAQSGEHLQQLLQEDHRYVFTLIQKFGTQRGERYPKLSDRDDIIVITDEAHRSQYDVLAMNMRDALP
ncbi:MAG: type I restriction endonuclease subunit R, partial [Anaerolineae bacterium]|nr:type I restriction endonuclease subunit R [Anaerolineae bacterium]